MKTAAFTTALAALTAAAFAQDNEFTNKSAPFDLIISSSNKTLDGSALFPCHEGAAIEALCWLGGPPTNTSVYNFNTSSFYPATNKSLGQLGVLYYNLPVNGGANETLEVPSPMSLSVDYTTNVVPTILMPDEGEYTTVAFDKTGKMNIQGYGPGGYTAGSTVKAFYNWYLCPNDYSGYMYNVLSWVVGGDEPDNASCQKVDVLRKFV